MQIGGTSPSSISNGAQIALKLITAAQVSARGETQSAASRQDTAEDRAAVRLDYLIAAKKAVTRAEPEFDPNALLPEGYSAGELVSVDTLEPKFREFAESFGATHVRVVTREPLSDADFQAQISKHLDESYADDPAYLAAKAEGGVTIRRLSDVMGELGETGQYDISLQFYRGENGSESFGGGYTGRLSEVFENYWQEQNQAGRYLAIGGAMGSNFVADWAAKSPD